MFLTPSIIQTRFSIFNDLYFNGELEEPRYFIITKAKTYLGQFAYHGSHRYGGWSEIKISTLYDLNELEFESILIHEMVHSWQWLHGYTDHHGVTFKRKAAEINMMTNFKYAIARYTNLSEKTLATYRPTTSKMMRNIWRKLVNKTNFFHLVLKK